MRKFVKCADTPNQKINVSLVPSPYDLQDLIEIDHGFYCLANENAIQATKDIIRLNGFLDDVPEICPEFPRSHISIADIKFEYNPGASPRDYVILKIESLTPSGKLPKYPICLIFPGIHLFYAQDKKVKKVRMIAWEKQNCYELNLAMHNGELGIHSIYKTSLSDSIKRKIYEYTG